MLHVTQDTGGNSEHLAPHTSQLHCTAGAGGHALELNGNMALECAPITVAPPRLAPVRCVAPSVALTPSDSRPPDPIGLMGMLWLVGDFGLPYGDPRPLTSCTLNGEE